MADIRQFLSLICINAGHGFELMGVYAGVQEGDYVFVHGNVYGRNEEGKIEPRLIETATQAGITKGAPFPSNLIKDMACFAECEVLIDGRVVIDLETIYAENPKESEK